MENVQTPHHVSLKEEFSSDPRWHLLERIFLTSPLQKSTRSLALLSYLQSTPFEGALMSSMAVIGICRRRNSSREPPEIFRLLAAIEDGYTYGQSRYSDNAVRPQ